MPEQEKGTATDDALHMVTLTIDGRDVSVEEGATILEAAGMLGIRIPTLCKVENFPPSASCFLCAVKIEGRTNLAPSCATPAADGMIVHTNSDEVRASRKTALELLLSDHVVCAKRREEQNTSSYYVKRL